MLIIIIFLNIILNFVLFKNLNFLQKILNISDIPNERKIHKSPVPLLGGTFFLMNLLFVFFIYCINDFSFMNLSFDKNAIISIIGGVILFYILGYLDDSSKIIRPNLRLFLSAIILGLVLYLDNELMLTSLKLSFLNSGELIKLNNYVGIILTIFSFLVLINAFNMTDGINLLSTFYIFYIFFVFFLLGIFNINFLFFLPFFIFFFIYNNKYQIFFGSSGIMPASFFVGYIFIKSYNQNILLYSDMAFIILLIPLLELLRLMFLRLRNSHNPFKADQNHLHHYIYNNFSYNKTILILLMIYIIPSLIVIFELSFHWIYTIIVIYFYLIEKYKKA